MAAVAHVQRAGGVGRDKLDQHALAVVGSITETLASGQHLAHDFLLGGGLQADVQKARSSDFDGIHPTGEGRRGLQCGLELFTQGAGIELEWLGQLHGGGAGEVAMGRHLGGFKRRLGASARGQDFQLGCKRSEQFIFGCEHRRILRGRAGALTEHAASTAKAALRSQYATDRKESWPGLRRVSPVSRAYVVIGQSDAGCVRCHTLLEPL
ncbi:hypothetical protein D3C71_1223550 [compost metagenome]